MSGRHRSPLEPSVFTPLRVALSATAAALVLQPLVPSAAAALGLPTPTPTMTPVTVPLAVPVPTSVLPVTTDLVPSYQSQRSCDPAAKPGVEAYARMVMQTYRVGRSGGIVRGCGIGATSEHKEGRAFDYMLSIDVPDERAAGDSLTAWLTGPDAESVMGGNARRLGIMYVIWNRRIWSTYSMGSGWKAYHGPSPHTDHIHTSFSWDGALQRTSWWSGTAVSAEDKGTCRVYAGQPAPVYTTRHLAACPTNLPSPPLSPYSIVWPGQAGSAVRVAQFILGVPADGVFGAATRSRLMGWQRSTAVPITGVLDKPTWVRLRPPPPPVVAPVPPTPEPLPEPGAVPVATPATRTSLTPYRSMVLRRGSTGVAVAALQRALKLTPDGAFGAATAVAVSGTQTRARLPVTGVVDVATWSAVERVAYPLLGYRPIVLQMGSTGHPVVVLQKALRIYADGSFAVATWTAVRAAQAKARLTQTGVVDLPTWVAVEAQAYPVGLAAAPPKPVAPAPVVVRKPVPRPAPAPVVSAQVVARTTSVSAYKPVTLRRGSRGAAVAALQTALGIKADGLFGTVTTTTVKAFQTNRKLPATGVVDRHTWDAAERVAYPLLPYRTAVLRVGSKGPAVAALQKALRLGADGRFGTKTQASVKAAQARGRIASTGTVAVLTWVTIEKQVYPLGRKRW